jgi:hypothetical protein
MNLVDIKSLVQLNGLKNLEDIQVLMSEDLQLLCFLVENSKVSILITVMFGRCIHLNEMFFIRSSEAHFRPNICWGNILHGPQGKHSPLFTFVLSNEIASPLQLVDAGIPAANSKMLEFCF